MLFCGGTHLQITGMSSLSARARAPAKLCICIRICLQILTPEMLANKTAVSPREPVVLHAPRCRLGRRDLSTRPCVRPSVCCYLCGVGAVADKALITVEEAGSLLSFSIARIRCSVRTTVKVGSAHAPSAPPPHHPLALFLPSHTPFSFAPDLYLPHFTTHRPQFS